MQIPAVECGGKAGSGMFQVTTGVSLLPRGATCGTSIPEGLRVSSWQILEENPFSMTEIPLDPRVSLNLTIPKADQLINFTFH